MTSPQAQLQKLLAEIEATLAKASPRLPWVMAGETGEQRRLLQEVRDCLVALQNQGPLAFSGGGGSEMASQQILQALLQEMQYLRTQTIQPLRAEVNALQQQRELLLREVQQLEATRQESQAPALGSGTAPPAWVDQVVERLQAGLTRQLRPYLQSLSSGEGALGQLADEEADLPQLQPQQRLEQVRQIQAQTDYLLLKLDSNLRAVFDSMEQSIQSYRESLHQGLDTMHGLGQQGEVIFQALVNHLAQQMEQGTYLDRGREGRLSAAGDRRPGSEGMAPRDRFRTDLSTLSHLEGGGQYAPSYGDGPDWAGQPESLEDTLDLETIDLGAIPSARAEFFADGDVTQWQLGDGSAIAPNGPDPFNDPLLAGFDEEEDWSDEDDLTVFQGSMGSRGESTVVQMEPISWEAMIGRTKGQESPGSAQGQASGEEGEESEEEYEELDALYESLFGNTLDGEAGDDGEGTGAMAKGRSETLAPDGEPDSDELPAMASAAGMALDEVAPDLAPAIDPSDLAPLELPPEEEELLFREGDEETADLSLPSTALGSSSPGLDPDQFEEPRINLLLEEEVAAAAIVPAIGDGEWLEAPDGDGNLGGDEAGLDEAAEDETAEWALDTALLETASNWGGAEAPPTITLALPEEGEEGTSLDDPEAVAMASFPGVEEFAASGLVEEAGTALEDWLFEGATASEALGEGAEAEGLGDSLGAEAAARGQSEAIPPGQALPTEATSPRSLAALFGETGAAEFPDTGLTSVPTTISTLTELLPPPGAAAFREPSLEEALELADASDLFIAAPPDENLLAIDDPGGAGPWNLELDLTETALAQLDTDLLGLEGLAAGNATPQEGEIRTLEDGEIAPAPEADSGTVDEIADLSDLGSATEPMPAAGEDVFDLGWGDDPGSGDISRLGVGTASRAPGDDLGALEDLAETLDGDPRAHDPGEILEVGAEDAEVNTLETLDSLQSEPILSGLSLVELGDGPELTGAGESLLPSVVDLLGEDPLAVEDLPMGALGAEVLGDIPAPDLLMESLLGEGFDRGFDGGLAGELGQTVAGLEDPRDSGESGSGETALGEIAAFFDSESTPARPGEPIEMPDSIVIALGDGEDDWVSAGDLLGSASPGDDDCRGVVDPGLGQGTGTGEDFENFFDDAPSDEDLLSDLSGVTERLEEPESLDLLGDWDGPSDAPAPTIPGETDTGSLLDTLLGDALGEVSAVFREDRAPTISSEPSLDLASDVAALGADWEGDDGEIPSGESDFRLDDFGDTLGAVPPEAGGGIPGQDSQDEFSEPGVASTVDPVFDPLAALEGDLGLDLGALGLDLSFDPEGEVVTPGETDAFSLGDLVLNLSLEDEEDGAIAPGIPASTPAATEDIFSLGDLSLNLSLEEEGIPEPAPAVGPDGPEIDLDPLPQELGTGLDISLEGLSGDGLDPLAVLGVAATSSAEVAPGESPLSLEDLLGGNETPEEALTLLTLEDGADPTLGETLDSLDLAAPAQGSPGGMDLLATDAATDGLLDATGGIAAAEASGLDAATALALENLAFEAEDLDLLATLAAEPPPSVPAAPAAPAEAWYLGLDVGTTGISAVLMNRTVGQAYPLYWSGSQKGSEMIFRLPAIATLLPAQGDQPWTVAATGIAALAPLPPRLPGHGDGPSPLSIRGFKETLGLGLTHEDDQGNAQPLVQWDDRHALPLAAILESFQSLLATIAPPRAGQAGAIAAAGLSPAALTTALETLQGVIVGDPTPSHDTYRFNIREGILGAGLVATAAQIFFVDDAIAALLSGLPDPQSPPLTSQNQGLYQCAWQGSTVVISAGASQTQLALVALPPQLNHLSLGDVALRTLAYGGQALDLDIISHLLIPADRRQPWNLQTPLPSNDATHWSAILPEQADPHWASLDLEGLTLPRLGEGDPETRRRLLQRLMTSPLGLALLEAAQVLKGTLQHQAQLTLVVGDQGWQVLRRDLESRILVPYIQRINQHLNTLLSQTGLTPQGVNQVVCTGGNGSFSMVARWLRQKFPNATIIQDTYPSDRPPSCSRVAYGLANLCRYPQLLDTPRHQYSDFFLLRELLDTLPETPRTLGEVIAHLERQGVHGAACEARILALLKGELPAGLGGDEGIRPCLSSATVDRAQYRALRSEPLFTRTGDRYTINPAQRDRLRQHLITLMVNKSQSLTEPLAAQWDGAMAKGRSETIAPAP